VDKKWVIPLASAVPILTIIYAFSLGPSPHKVLSDFKTAEVAESALIEPLLDAERSEIEPLLIAEIASKDMVRRSHAIQYLARIESTGALPVLEAILADQTEQDLFRAGALAAISAIDPARGRKHALTYRERRDELGRIAREMLAGRPAVVGTRAATGA
jgi:hypothetical protein